MRIRALSTLTLALALAGCSVGRTENAFGTFGGAGDETQGAAEASTSGVSATATGGSAGSGADIDDSGGGPLLDVAAPGGADDGGGGGCDKVDFLFVVDNSGSMADEQAQLVAAFPKFMSSIQSTLEANSYHIMVIDTDAAAVAIPSNVQCTPDPGCCVDTCASLGPTALCNGIPCPAPPGECDSTLGAGKDQDVNGMSCNLDGDQRFITDAQTDIDAAFACLGAVGTNGTGLETQVLAALEAISKESQASACNEGFLRDDAVLVVTFITDEEDDPNDPGDEDLNSPGDPQAWFDALVEAKHGDPSAVVMLSLVGDIDVNGSPCTPFNPEQGSGAEPAPRLRQLAELFGDRGIWGSVCASDYSPFFDEAVGLIDTACDDYIPPG